MAKRKTPQELWAAINIKAAEFNKKVEEFERKYGDNKRDELPFDRSEVSKPSDDLPF